MKVFIFFIILPSSICFETLGYKNRHFRLLPKSNKSDESDFVSAVLQNHNHLEETNWQLNIDFSIIHPDGYPSFSDSSLDIGVHFVSVPNDSAINNSFDSLLVVDGQCFESKLYSGFSVRYGRDICDNSVIFMNHSIIMFNKFSPTFSDRKCRRAWICQQDESL